MFATRCTVSLKLAPSAVYEERILRLRMWRWCPSMQLVPCVFWG